MIEDITTLISGANVIQRERDDDSFPIVNGEEVRFNGIEEDGHEIFFLQRKGTPSEWTDNKNEVFNFCKTAHKPYDVYVTAVLLIAKLHLKDNIRLASDGGVSDWQAGVALVNSKLGKNVRMLENEKAEYPDSVGDAIIEDVEGDNKSGKEEGVKLADLPEHV